MFADVHTAINRETEIKAWRREKKVRLIESKNATWRDLAAQLPHVYTTKQSTKQIGCERA
jgi:predicted GIY-YIG superfamily endonuclease